MDFIFLDFFASHLWPLFDDFQLGRIAESLILVFILLWRLRPHMNVIEDRLKGVEKGIRELKGTVSINLKKGDDRLDKQKKYLKTLDDRVQRIEDHLKL